jgi:hypothetical protein
MGTSASQVGTVTNHWAYALKKYIYISARGT